MNPALFAEKYIHDKYVYILLAIKLLDDKYDIDEKECDIIKRNIINLEAPVIVYDFIKDLLNVSQNEIHKLEEIDVTTQINKLKNNQDNLIDKYTMIATKFEMKDKLDIEIDELYNKYHKIERSYLLYLIGLL